MRTESVTKAQKAYRKSMKKFQFEVSRRREADMVAFLEGKDSIQAYVKRLIRQDMEG